MNRRLINSVGKRLGTLEDLVINCKNNTVEKIVLSRVGALEEDGYVALPYEPLGFTAYGLVYDIEPRRLKEFTYSYKE
jgi:hypothetical protein